MSSALAVKEKVKVLVVEDSEDQRILLRHNFERAGCDVTTVSSAEEAILAYSRSTPDLAVIDLTLPDMSGWQLTERIRQERPDCVVAVTWAPDEGERPSSNAVLPRPFTAAQIRKVLRDFVPKWSAL